MTESTKHSRFPHFRITYRCKKFSVSRMNYPGNSYRRGSLSTVDLLVLNSLDQLLVKMQILLTFSTKTSYLDEEVNCTEPSPFSKASRVLSHMCAKIKA